MLERLGINSSGDCSTIKTKNIAAVMVTALLPPFAKQGNRLDVLVSSVGDAKALAGGTLMMAPLKGADGQVYAVAQGPILTNSFSYGGQASSSVKNHPTAGTVPGGALIERELPNVLADKQNLKLNLHQADFMAADVLQRWFIFRRLRRVVRLKQLFQLPEFFPAASVFHVEESAVTVFRFHRPAEQLIIQDVINVFPLFFRHAGVFPLLVRQHQCAERNVLGGKEPFQHGAVKIQLAGTNLSPFELEMLGQAVLLAEGGEFCIENMGAICRTGEQAHEHGWLPVMWQMATFIAVEVQRCSGDELRFCLALFHCK